LGDHGKTFGGNPLEISATNSSLVVLVDQSLCEVFNN